MTNWDHSVDLLIAGSGGGGMVAALAALDSGIEPLVIEKQALVGGSTGTFRRHGVAAEQPADARRRNTRLARGRSGVLRRRRRRHRAGVVAGPPRNVSHRGLRDDQLPHAQGRSPCPVPRLQRLLPESQGRQRDWPLGRGHPVRRGSAGHWSDKVQPSMAKNYGGFVVKTNELRSVQYFNRSPRAFAVAMRCSRVPGPPGFGAARCLTNGASLIGQMLKVLIDLSGGEPPIWTDTAMDDLIVEDGRVVGARVTRDGASLNIEARKGVLLAAGGFSRNADMRRRYSGDQPNEAQVVHRERGRHRRGAADGDAARREDRPVGRSVVAAISFHRRRPRAAVHSAAAGSGPGQSTSTAPAGGSATSRTPTSRSARRCTPTRRCRVG